MKWCPQRGFCPQSGWRRSPRDRSCQSLPHNHRAERIWCSHARPLPRAKGLCTFRSALTQAAPAAPPSPSGRQEDTLSQTSSSHWVSPGDVVQKQHCCPGERLGTPQTCRGQSLPELQHGVMHSKLPQTQSRVGTICPGSSIRRPGFSPLCEGSCLHPGQTPVTLASQSKRPLMSCKGELGPRCRRMRRCFQLASSLLLALPLGRN